MKITAREYALAAAKANRENKILRIKNGEFIFEEPPVVVEEEDVLFEETGSNGLGFNSQDDGDDHSPDYGVFVEAD